MTPHSLSSNGRLKLATSRADFSKRTVSLRSAKPCNGPIPKAKSVLKSILYIGKPSEYLSFKGSKSMTANSNVIISDIYSRPFIAQRGRLSLPKKNSDSTISKIKPKMPRDCNI